MKKLLAPLILLLGATSVFAQSDTGVTVSTDPARAEAVERHAQMLQSAAAPTPMPMHKSSAASMPAHKSSAKTPGHHGPAHHDSHHQPKS